MPLSWILGPPSEWCVAQFLKEQEARGKTASKTSFRALEWASRCFELDLHSRSPLVKAHSRPRQVAALEHTIVQARVVTVTMVNAMEQLVHSAPTLRLRIFA